MSEELRPIGPDEEDLEWDKDVAYRLAADGSISQEQLDKGEIREELQDAVQEGIKSWGGKRPNSGRKRQRLTLSVEVAESLHLLTKMQKLARHQPELTEEDIVSELVEREWQSVQAEFGPVEKVKPRGKSGTFIA